MRHECVGNVMLLQTLRQLCSLHGIHGEICQLLPAVFDILPVNGHQHVDAAFGNQCLDGRWQDGGAPSGGNGGENAFLMQFVQRLPGAFGHMWAARTVITVQRFIDVKENDFRGGG